MPLYEYKCRSCSSEYELMRSMSKAGESLDCPACQAFQGLERVLSASHGRVQGGTPRHHQPAPRR